jgi:MoaA/NifB/PqqE/SkfB family radical SAM enzyme
MKSFTKKKSKALTRPTQPGCNHMNNHLSIVDSKGWITTCCQYDHQNEMPNLNDVTTLDGILDSKIVKRKRKELLAGKRIVNCKMCWKQEDIGMRSHRWWAWDFNQYVDVKRGKLQNLEIGLDYTCNMMCRMCKPSLSSKWNSATEVNKVMQTIDSDHHDGHYTYGAYQKDIKRVLENTDLSELKKLQLVGGEPFYSKNFDWLMQKIDNETDVSDLIMHVATNGSIIPENSLDILKRMGRLQIGFSLDAVGDLANCIRWGIDFATIDKNIDRWIKMRDEFPNIVIGVHCTVNIMNMNKLNDLIDYCRNKGLKISTNVLQGPKHLIPYQIPTNERRKFDVKTFDKSENATHTMKKIVHADMPAENHLEGFLKSCEVLDAYQGIKFSDVNPEIYKLAERYK